MSARASSNSSDVLEGGSPAYPSKTKPRTTTRRLDDGSDGTRETDDSSRYSDDSDSDSDSSDYSDISECDDEDLELDDLEQELLCFDLQQQRRRRASANDALGRRIATASNTATAPATTTSRRASMPATPQDLFQRMALAHATNSYYQDPNSKDTVVSVLVSNKNNVNNNNNSANNNNNTPEEEHPHRPHILLQETLQGSHYITATTCQSSSWEHYFEAVTPERVAAHSLVVVKAIRRANVAALRQLLQQGVPLHGCNPQGESSLHLACRLGNLDVVRFLIEDAHVSLRVRDDQGKTPLHDALWTPSPQFDLVEYIVDQAPELLFLTDYRGYTAWQYVPDKDCNGDGCRAEWCRWIISQQSWLREKVHHSTWLKARDQLDDAQLRMQRLLAKAAQYS